MTLNSPYYHFEVGDFKATLISDGQSAFPPYPLYATNATQAAVEESLVAHFLPTKSYLLQCNCLYLERGKDKILIDTGAGDDFSQNIYY